MSDNTTTILDLDALLDTSMDSVETLPDYVKLSKGIYRFKVEKAEIIKGKDKKTNEAKATLGITYSILETKESEEPPFPNGSLTSDRFQATEDGLKYFKKKAMNILNVSDLGTASLREILDGLAGEEFDAIVTIKVSTGEDGKSYENVNIRAMHAEPAA